MAYNYDRSNSAQFAANTVASAAGLFHAARKGMRTLEHLVKRYDRRLLSNRSKHYTNREDSQDEGGALLGISDLGAFEKIRSFRRG